MTFTCRYVDDDLTTVLLDLNGAGDWTGSGFALMGDPDFGPVNRSVALLKQQGVDGAVLASASDDVTVLTATVAVRAVSAASTDQIVSLWRDLAFRLSAGGYIEMKMANESESRFYSALSSGVPNLISGQKDAVLHVSGYGFETNPSPCAILLQPAAMLATRVGTVQKLTNASLLVDTDGAGRPDGSSYSATTGITAEAISNSRRAYRVTRNSATSIDFRLPTSAAASGDFRVFSLYASADLAGISQVTLGMEWLDGGGAVLRTDLGTLTPLGPVTDPDDRPRLSVTNSTAAPASTANVRPIVRMANASASTVITELAQAQVETGATASAWRLGTEASGNGVASAAGFIGRILLHNPGNTWGLVKLSVDPTAGNVVQMRAWLRSMNRPKGKTSNFVEWLNVQSRGYECESATLSTGTASVAVGAASGGNVAQTTFTAPPADDQGILVQCWSQPILPTDPDALTGTFEVWAAVSTSAAAKFRLQIRTPNTGLLVGGIQSPILTNAPVTYDTTNIAGGDLSQYSLISLGTFTIDPDRGDNGISLQGWASLETAGSAAKLNWDCFFLMPADETVAAYTEPTFVPGTTADDFWAGNQLTTPPSAPAGLIAGTVVRDILVLGTQTMAGGTPQAKYAAGRHTWTTDVALFTDDGGAEQLSTFHIYNVTGAADIKSVTIKGKSGQRWTRQTKTLNIDIPGDAATTDNILAYVNENHATGAGLQTDVYSISHHATISATGGSSQPFVVDAVTRTVYVRTGNQLLRKGDFIRIPPGFSVLSLVMLDRGNNGFDQVYTGPQGPEIMAAFVAARAYNVSRDVVPQVKGA